MTKNTQEVAAILAMEVLPGRGYVVANKVMGVIF